ncbi:MAG: GIY-YIG nuclease family protein [Rheinheimera sp.]
MENLDSRKVGYVYILEVKDIFLPVCKIGMTQRTPDIRCKEINKSSTGDFIWEVTNFVYVNDCIALETLLHEKLSPLKQKNREFFNLRPADAFEAIKSILSNQSLIVEVSSLDNLAKTNDIKKTKKSQTIPITSDDKNRTVLLHNFSIALGVKARPFGQLNHGSFGVSDGNEGTQWNLHIFPEAKQIRLGVNLEGMKYKNWPIAALIQSELKHPRLLDVVARTNTKANFYLSLRRDAWQVHARPTIKEQLIGGQEFALCELTSEKWQNMLLEALDCLDKEKNFMGRTLQTVTIKTTGKCQTMQVSPHLTIWLAISEEDSIQEKLTELKPIHEWMSQFT